MPCYVSSRVELTKDATIAGRYQLGRLLGEGGMGAVWAATELATGHSFALKFLHRADPTPHRRRRFLREARAAMALTHPNVVRIHEVMADVEPTDPKAAQWPFLVMDLLEGESLSNKLERSRVLALDEFAPLFAQMVSAAGAAHASGVVHRDLKPANIFLVHRAREGENVRVLDFGIAKLTTELDGLSTSLTGTGDVLGTPQYMSPEQIFGESDVDHRSDVWSLGVIAFQCLSGAHPVAAENVGQILKAITTGKLTRLGRVAPRLPTAVTDLVDRMLSRDRTKRPRDLREVLETFSRYTSVVVPAIDAPRRRAPADDALAGEQTAEGQATLDEPLDQVPHPRGTRRRVIPVALAIVATASIVGLSFSNRGPAPAPITSGPPPEARSAVGTVVATPPLPTIVSAHADTVADTAALQNAAGSPTNTVASTPPPLRPKRTSSLSSAPTPAASSAPSTTMALPVAPTEVASASNAAPSSAPSAKPSGGLITKTPF